MASIGLKRFRYAPLNIDGETYGTVSTLAGAIECQVSLDLAEATLYADDVIKEYASVFKSGTITLGIDDDNDTVFANLLGNTIETETGIVTSNVQDTPIYVGFGHVVPKLINNIRMYKIEFFPKVKFKPFVSNATTKGDSLEFTTPSVEATIFENNDGIWEKHNIYTSEAEANISLDAFFVQTSLIAPVLAQPASATAAINVTDVQAGTLFYEYKLPDGVTTTSSSLSVTNTTVEIPAPAGNWANGTTIHAKLQLATGQTSPWSNWITITIT